jgi:predicted O-methyltransferase YrrM
LSPNCVIVADNVVYPGAPDYMQYVSSVDGLWQTVVEKAPFERVGFETRWQQKEDGMAISHRTK